MLTNAHGDSLGSVQRQALARLDLSIGPVRNEQPDGPSRWRLASVLANNCPERVRSCMKLIARLMEWRFKPPKSLGQRGEAAAARFLKLQRYKIIAVGDRTGLGEIDIVAVDGRTLVFVEVKTRRSSDAGLPGEAVDQPKQQRLTKLALSYLKRHGLLEYKARFDVVAVTWPVDAKQPEIEHFVNAFSAVGSGQMFC